MAIKLYTGGVKLVAAAGSAEAISSNQIPVSSVYVEALSTNTGSVYVGDDNVDSTNGITLSPGESTDISGDQRKGFTDEFLLHDIYVDSAVNGEGVRFLYIKQRR